EPRFVFLHLTPGLSYRFDLLDIDCPTVVGVGKITQLLACRRPLLYLVASGTATSTIHCITAPALESRWAAGRAKYFGLETARTILLTTCTNSVSGRRHNFCRV